MLVFLRIYSRSRFSHPIHDNNVVMNGTPASGVLYISLAKVRRQRMIDPESRRQQRMIDQERRLLVDVARWVIEKEDADAEKLGTTSNLADGMKKLVLDIIRPKGSRR